MSPAVEREGDEVVIRRKTSAGRRTHRALRLSARRDRAHPQRGRHRPRCKSGSTAMRPAFRCSMRSRRRRRARPARSRSSSPATQPTTFRCCTRPPTKAGPPARTPHASPRANLSIRGLRRAPLAIVFTDPQIAIVGGGFAALQPGRFETGQRELRGPGALAHPDQEPGPAARLRRPRDGTAARRRNGRARGRAHGPSPRVVAAESERRLPRCWRCRSTIRSSRKGCAPRCAIWKASSAPSACARMRRPRRAPDVRSP